jgi:hypothetical protein
MTEARESAINRETQRRILAAADYPFDVRNYRTTIGRNKWMRIDHVDLPTSYSEETLTELHRGYYVIVPTDILDPVITFLTKEKAIRYAEDHFAYF